jgi:hypothetical protein
LIGIVDRHLFLVLGGSPAGPFNGSRCVAGMVDETARPRLRKRKASSISMLSKS